MTHSAQVHESAAAESGYLDATAGPDGARWFVLHLAGVTDGELSDYWRGWNRGRFESRRKRE
jgi:hypothetical protein